MKLLSSLTLDHCYLVITPHSAGVMAGFPGQAGYDAFRQRVPGLVCAVNYAQLKRCAEEDLDTPVFTTGPSHFVCVSPGGVELVKQRVDALGNPPTTGLSLAQVQQALSRCRAMVHDGALVLPDLRSTKKQGKRR